MKTLGDIGERKAIELILEKLEKMPRMPIPFGDDVSAYPISRNQFFILKTDMLVGETDIPKGMSVKQAARKAVIMNISDFAAKGAKPLVALVSLGMPRNMAQKELEEIGDGLNTGAREYDTYIVGGDTNEASDLIISLSVFGIAKKDNLMLRSGAKPNDIVAITGLFGKTSAGLKILLEGFNAPRDIHGSLVEAVFMPKARLKEGLALSRTKVVTSAIDSSDGLALSLYEISKASNIGFVIESLPISPEAKKFAEINGLDPFELTFYGGEEYELVLTINSKFWDKAEKAVKNVGSNLIKIGKVTAEKNILFKGETEERVIEPKGWEHFRRY